MLENVPITLFMNIPLKNRLTYKHSIIPLFCLMVSQAVSNMMEEFDWHRLVLLYRFTIYYFINNSA